MRGRVQRYEYCGQGSATVRGVAELSGGYAGRGVVESWRVIWMARQCKPDSGSAGVRARSTHREYYSVRVVGQQDKRAEAMGDLALCYWRSGAQDHGRALFRQAVDAAQKPETKLRTLTNASTVEISSGRYTELSPCSMTPLLFSRRFQMMRVMAVITGNVDLYTEDLAGQRIWTMP